MPPPPRSPTRPRPSAVEFRAGPSIVWGAQVIDAQEIIAELSNLSVKQLQQVRAACDAYLQRVVAGDPATSASSAPPTVRGIPVSTLLHGALDRAFRDEGLGSFPPDPALTRTGLSKSMRTATENLAALMQGAYPPDDIITPAQAAGWCRVLVDVAMDKCRDVGVDVTPKAVLGMLQNPRGLIARAFPGYAGSHLLSMIVQVQGGSRRARRERDSEGREDVR